MTLLMKVTVIAVVVSLLGLLLRRNTPELALLLSLAAVAAVMMGAMAFYEDMQGLVSRLLERSGVSEELFTPIVKIIAISIITRIGSDLCQDSGQKVLGAVVELAGTLCALVSAAPLLQLAMELLAG